MRWVLPLILCVGLAGAAEVERIPIEADIASPAPKDLVTVTVDLDKADCDRLVWDSILPEDSRFFRVESGTWILWCPAAARCDLRIILTRPGVWKCGDGEPQMVAPPTTALGHLSVVYGGDGPDPPPPPPPDPQAATRSVMVLESADQDPKVAQVVRSEKLRRRFDPMRFYVFDPGMTGTPYDKLIDEAGAGPYWYLLDDKDNKVWEGDLPDTVEKCLDVLTGATTSQEPQLWILSAEWCGPCQPVKEAGRRLKEEGFSVYIVDVAKQPEMLEHFGVKTVPFIAWAKAGKILGKENKAMTYEQMKEKLQ